MPDEIGTDYLVVGAGPAGLQLGYFLGRAGRGHVVLESGEAAGTFYTRYPRHRRMISINKPHTGWSDPELRLRMDWNSLISDDPDLRFTRYTGRYFPDASDYVRYLRDFAAQPEINVRYRAAVTRIARAGDGFDVATADGTAYRAKRVIVATGFGAPYVPPIPGIELAEKYTEMPVDPDDFTDQRVLIIGKGNSAFETADNLIERAAVIHVAGPSELRFAWRTHFIGNLRAVNNNFLDTYQLKAQNMVLDAHILGIEERGGAYDVTLRYVRRDKTVTLTYDRVLACTGFRLDDSIFAPDTRPELTIRDRLPALTAEWESVNVPGLYFAGTLTQSRDFRKYTSAFIHGFRYGVRALQRILDAKYAGLPWPHRTLPADPAAMADAIIARINRTAALWDQFSFLCDVLVIDDDGTVRYCEEQPLDYVHEHGTADTFVTVSLEWGEGHDSIDPFDLTAGRAWEDDPAKDDRYLHPVVRFHRRGEPPAVLKLPEEICNDWSSEDEFRVPLKAFLAEQLADRSALVGKAKP